MFIFKKKKIVTTPFLIAGGVSSKRKSRSREVSADWVMGGGVSADEMPV